MLRHFDGIQLGLTATPCVAVDGQAEDDAAFVRDTLRFFGVEEPTFRYGIAQAIEDGYVVPYQIYKAKTVKTASVDGFEVYHDELDWSAMDDATAAELREAFGDAKARLARRMVVRDQDRRCVEYQGLSDQLATFRRRQAERAGP